MGILALKSLYVTLTDMLRICYTQAVHQSIDNISHLLAGSNILFPSEISYHILVHVYYNKHLAFVYNQNTLLLSYPLDVNSVWFQNLFYPSHLWYK